MILPILPKASYCTCQRNFHTTPDESLSGNYRIEIVEGEQTSVEAREYSKRWYA
jgi:hypothetical protein